MCVCVCVNVWKQRTHAVAAAERWGGEVLC
jgi:hypothetical protein